MRTNDQRLIEEAYTAISESNLRSSLGHIAFVTKYENIIKELHNKKISYSEAMAKQSNLLMEIIKWMKSSSQKPIDSVEKAYKSVDEEEGSFFKNKPNHSPVEVSPEVAKMYYSALEKFQNDEITSQQWYDICAKLLGDLMEQHKDVFVRLKHR